MPYRFVTVEGPVVLEGGADDIAFEMAARHPGETGAKAYVEQTTGLESVVARITPERWRTQDYSGWNAEAMTRKRSASWAWARTRRAGIGGSLVSAGSHVVSVLADRSTASRVARSRRASKRWMTWVLSWRGAASCCRSCPRGSHPRSRTGGRVAKDVGAEGAVSRARLRRLQRVLSGRAAGRSRPLCMQRE